MDEITSKIEILIYRFLRGALSDSEREELDRWLREGKHQEWFDRICDRERLFQKSLRLDRLNERKEESWRYLDRKTGLRTRRMVLRWVVAASLVIPLFIGVLYFKGERQFEPVAHTRILDLVVPGMKTAGLYLPDGEVVQLNSDSTSSLALVGHEGFRNENGTLIYQPDQVSKGIPRYSEIKIPRGGEYKMVLPDGTTVWLNAESSLRFPDVFSGGVRKVYARGELYFEVTRDEKRPFLVEVEGDYTVEVLGTEFNLRAYGDGSCVTTLVKGSVRVKEQEQTVLLVPGEQAVKEDGGGLEVKKVDVRSSVAWREGNFFFRQARLEDIMTELARWYDVQVLFENEEMRNELFSIEMKRFEDFNQVLKLIERTGIVHMVVDGHTVTVR